MDQVTNIANPTVDDLLITDAAVKEAILITTLK
jgi:hypothetical protein